MNQPPDVPIPSARRSDPVARGLLVLAFVLVAWFDGWTLQSTGHGWKFGAKQTDYYNLLIDGWLEGHLHMKADVPESLLKVPNPYDPLQRPPGVALHDASLYHGKYYVYFGVAPVMVLMLPFRLITHCDLPLAFATFAFVYGGFLVSAGLWLDLRRRYFPDSSRLAGVIGVLVLGAASLAPVLLRRPQMWELPIAAGYCFAMAALWCVGRALHAPERRVRWFGAAAVGLGLAIGSRPTYLFATPLLALPLLLWWRTERRLPWRAAVGAVAPLALIGGLMALHNYLRFGSPLEFGQTYQLTYFDETKMPHFSVRYTGFNGWRYFFSRAQWSPYFPFIAPAELPPKPPGFSGHDDVYGVLANLPIGWFALFAPLALRKRTRAEHGVLGAWLGAAALQFSAMAAVLMCFFGSLARYEVDFTPALMLLACVGVLAVERACRGRVAPIRVAAYFAWLGAAALALIFAALFTLQYDNQLQTHNPGKAAAVARLLNWIPYGLERLQGVEHGAIELELEFPSHQAGDEVLLTVGDLPNVDRLIVRYDDDGRVQFVVAPAEQPEMASRPLRIDFGKRHGLRLTLGSLLPPDTHPMFRHTPPADATEVTRRVRVALDGEIVLNELREFSFGDRQLRVGRDVAAEAGRRFSGDVRHVRRLKAAPVAKAESFVRLRVSFPETISEQREPLLGFAATDGDGGVVFVHYVDDGGQVAFGVSAMGERKPEGEAMVIDFKRAHEVIVRVWPTNDPGTRRVELRLDNVIVGSQELPWPPALAAPVPGRNIAREPRCAATFTGRIHSVQRGTDGRDPLLAATGDELTMRVRFPTGHPSVAEPLLVTGCTGAGDFLMVEYLDAGKLRFALDHWGGSRFESEPVAIDRAATHELTLATPILWAAAGEAPLRTTRNGTLRIAIDGVVVWRTVVPAYAARPDELAVGRNPIGGTSTTERFSGDILSAERTAR